MKRIDGRSLLIGVLLTLLLITLAGAASDAFSPMEIARLKKLASYLQDDGNLNLGNRRIIMLGSSIYDDGSQGGGLILHGGANRVQVRGNAVFYNDLEFKRDTVKVNANLNLGNRRIIMLGSSIYDDGSQGGGLQLRGGANRIHFFGKTIPH